jgi:hypothetical protein
VNSQERLHGRTFETDPGAPNGRLLRLESLNQWRSKLIVVLKKTSRSDCGIAAGVPPVQ